MKLVWLVALGFHLFVANEGRVHQSVPYAGLAVCSSGKNVDLRRPLNLRLTGGDDAESAPAVAVPPNPNRIYVGNLHFKTTEENIKEFLKDAGTVVSIEFKKTNKGNFKGVVLVDFENESQAKKAVHQLGGALLLGRTVVVRPDAGFDPKVAEEKRKKREEALERSKKYVESLPEEKKQAFLKGQWGRNYWPAGSPKARVYVGNVRYGSRWEELRQHMLKAGTVVFGRIIKQEVTREDGTKALQSRGFAVVQFSTPQEADNAIKTLDTSKFNGRRLVVREHTGRVGRIASRRPDGDTGAGGADGTTAAGPETKEPTNSDH